jgi:hypothetical protein
VAGRLRSAERTAAGERGVSRCQTYVYFIATFDRSMVKIGCSNNPPKRLEGLSVWSPVKLELLAHVPGTLRDEFALHRRYLSRYSHKEWFHSTPEMLADIAAIARFGELPTQFRGHAKETSPIRQHFGVRNTPEWKAKVSEVHKNRWVRQRRVRAFERIILPFLDLHSLAPSDFNKLFGHDVVYGRPDHRWCFESGIPHFEAAELFMATYKKPLAGAA